MIEDWLDLQCINPVDWVTFHNVEARWLHLVHAHPIRRKAIVSLDKLVS
jgi:hypothetical protein